MEYVIGSGAILEAGPQSGITPAALHANLDAPAGAIEAAAFDFDGTCAERICKMLVIVKGASPAAVRDGIEIPLRSRGDCSLGDVFETLASAARTRVVHLFAHWLPDEATVTHLAERGIELVAHPVESVCAASVVSGQRHRRVA